MKISNSVKQSRKSILHAMSFKGKRGGGVADVIEKSSSSFIGWNFHLHTDENGSASEASRFFLMLQE